MRHVVDLTDPDPGLRKAVLDRPVGKATVMLDPGEALFLNRGDDLTVGNECRSGVPERS
jgi:hypothetical protein